MKFAAVVLPSLLFSTLASAQFTQQGSKLVGSGASDPAVQGVGVALSGDGNTAIVGGQQDHNFIGAAWVWTRRGGVWTQQGSKLVGSNPFSPAHQGISVALSSDGNTALVGGESDDGGKGAVWVWTRGGGAWTEQAKLAGSGTFQQGHAVALSADGNTALVGAPTLQGDALVWTRSGSNWSQQGPPLVGTGSVPGSNGSEQGWSVGISADGNTALVGGDLDNNGAGAAWVFTRSNGVWTQQGPKLVGTGSAGGQGSSAALSADGNTALIGGGDASWVWTRSNGSWTQQALLVGTGGNNSAQGSAVALSADGNLAMVGGYQDDFGKGAAWFFTRSGGTWTQQGDKLVGSGLEGLAQQGTSVALSSDGKTAITGGFGDDGYRGAAWIFTTWAAPSTPTGFDATVQATTLVDLGWSASTGADEYEILRASSGGSLTLASTAATAYADSTASSGEGYVYKVRALGPGGTSAYSTPAVGATFAFVNDPLVAGATVRAVHVTEARDAVNAVRATAGLASQSWTDSPLVSGSTPVRAAQILEVRTALVEALGILGVPAPSFANGIAAGTVIRAVDVQELRAAVH